MALRATIEVTTMKGVDQRIKLGQDRLGKLLLAYIGTSDNYWTMKNTRGQGRPRIVRIICSVMSV